MQTNTSWRNLRKILSKYGWFYYPHRQIKLKFSEVSCIMGWKYHALSTSILRRSRPYEVGIIANKADLHSEFQEADFNKLHRPLGSPSSRAKKKGWWDWYSCWSLKAFYSKLTCLHDITSSPQQFPVDLLIRSKTGRAKQIEIYCIWGISPVSSFENMIQLSMPRSKKHRWWLWESCNAYKIHELLSS